MKKLKISKLSRDFRYLQKLALKVCEPMEVDLDGPLLRVSESMLACVESLLLSVSESMLTSVDGLLELMNAENVFDIETEVKEYCSSEVDILRRCGLQFKQL